jgi:hypothetical protein
MASSGESSWSTWASINKLKGAENYHSWSMAMRTMLDLNGLEGCIVTGEGAIVDAEKQKKAKGRILFSIDESLYVHVENASGFSKRSETGMAK